MTLQFKIFDEREDDTFTRLRLMPDGKDVRLVVVDGRGEPVSGGILLTLRRDGCAERCADMDPELGFEADGTGRLAFDD